MEVQIACVCPRRADGSPQHQQDTVTLRERLDFRTVIAMRNDVMLLKLEEEVSAGEIFALLTDRYLTHGIESWTLVDGKGKPVEPSRTAIKAFLAEHIEEASVVGDAADSMYAPVVVLPLVNRAQTSSPPTSTDVSTSASKGSGPKRPTPLRRSSTTTSRTGATATTTESPDGDSSSSRSTESAA